MNRSIALRIIVAVALGLLTIFGFSYQVNNQEVNNQEAKSEILCVEYTADNICKHGVDPKLWNVVDHSDQFGVIYFCQETGMSTIGDRCFFLYSNQTSEVIKDKINKVFGTQIK
jgi:hypothetical protein